MSDWYQAVLDLDSQSDEADFFATQVVVQLATDGLIKPRDDQDGIFIGSGVYVPGPSFSNMCGVQDDQLLTINPYIWRMEVHVGPWVNNFGLAGLEQITCPICATIFGLEAHDHLTKLKEGFSHASHLFCTGEPFPIVSCPVCQSGLIVQDWQTRPHLGFCYLAVLFWNWPPFSEWSEDIPLLISKTLGHKTELTYGYI